MLTEVSTATATIANGASVSDAVDIRFRQVVGYVIPAAWTAAGISFQLSYDGGTTYVVVKRVEFGTTTAPIAAKTIEILAADTAVSTMYAINPVWFLGATHIKVVSQTAGVAVNQGAARSVLVVMRQAA